MFFKPIQYLPHNHLIDSLLGHHLTHHLLLSDKLLQCTIPLLSNLLHRLIHGCQFLLLLNSGLLLLKSELLHDLLDLRDLLVVDANHLVLLVLVFAH